MKTKKLSLLVFSVVGLLGLTACSNEVRAYPTDYNEKLITIKNYEKEVYNNCLSVVYDAIESGGVGEDVLNKMLLQYSQGMLGTYSELYEAVKGNGDINKFVNTHRAYWTLNEDGERVDDNNKVVSGDNVKASPSEAARVSEKLKAFDRRVAQIMYSKISDGSYSDRNYFSESEFLKSLRTSLKKVSDPNNSKTKLYEHKLLLPKYEPEQVFENFLHLENYYSDSNKYLETDVFPDIYNEFLTEQYLLDSSYNSIGRSYARKVNIIQFSASSSNPFAAKYLADALAQEIRDGKTISAPDATKTNDSLLDRFKVYDRAYVGAGITEDSDEYKLFTENENLKSQFPEIKEGGNFSYFKSTDYGALIEKYNKIKVDPQKTDTSIEDEFTNNGAYSIEQGKAIKIDELLLQDHTTTGWFIKNGGLSDLPEAIRNRLFNISVANGVKETKEERDELDRFDSKTKKYVGEKEGESGYIARINGRNYLKKDSRVDGEEDYKDIIHYDSTSKAYYIIEVQEAVSSTKLSKTSSSSYYKTRKGTDLTQLSVESIINSVSEIVGKSESYETEAKKYYLEKMEIVYHDDAVYSYFETNYPELFD